MKTIPMLMMALLLFSAMPLIAAENTEVEVVHAGVTPDSPLYGLERAMERIQLAFIRNKAERAKFKLDLAEERLAEAEVMIEEDNEEAAEEAQELHDELINETEQEIEDLESNGDEETAENALDGVEDLQLRLLNHSAKVAFVKNRILEKMRNSENVSAEKLAHLERVFGKIIAKAQEIELKVQQKRENIRTKFKVLSELNESELSDREKAFLERKQEQEQRREKIKSKLKCEFGDDEFECEYGEDEDYFDDEIECVVDADCEDDEICINSECEDSEDDEEESDDENSETNKTSSNSLGNSANSGRR